MNLYLSSLLGIFLPIIILSILEKTIHLRIAQNELIIFTAFGYIFFTLILYWNSPFYIAKLKKIFIKHSNHKDYNEDGKLIREYSYYGQKVLDGKYIEYYPSSIIKILINYKDGLKNGKEINFNESGNIISQCKYLDNLAISGIIFKNGKKIIMTNAHLHELNKDYLEKIQLQKKANYNKFFTPTVPVEYLKELEEKDFSILSNDRVRKNGTWDDYKIIYTNNEFKLEKIT